MITRPANVRDLCAALVRLPSVNPDGDPGTPHIGEERCARWLADYLRPWAASVELQEVQPGRPNVVARLSPGGSGKPRLLFAPHTDTVSVVGMTIDPFGGEIREGCVWGRGASDTKGPMAAMLQALHDCRDLLPDLSHEIWFAGLMGEEAGQDGAKALASREAFDFVVVGEPTGLDVVYCHKVDLPVRILARGRAAHSSNPALGDNAVLRLCRGLLKIEAFLQEEFGKLENPVLGHPTCSVGTIRGGSKFNIVPDAAEAVLDLRLLPEQWGPRRGELILERLREQCSDLDFTPLGGSAPLNTDPDHPMVRRLQAAGGRAVGAPWFCDAAIFSAHGMPAVAVGPGSVAQAHTRDEFIAVADLEAGVEFFRRFLRSLSGPDLPAASPTL